MIGDKIKHYKILEKLGEGEMGVVYKTMYTKLNRTVTLLNRTVTLNFLPPHFTKSKKDRKRFISEEKTAVALNHLNISTIHITE